MKSGTIDDLKKIIALSDLPDEHLQWILDRSDYAEQEDGMLLLKAGDPADEMMLLVEGKIPFYMKVGNKLVYYITFENNAQYGGLVSLIPYSRMTIIPGNAYSSGKVRYYTLHKKYFSELEKLNPKLILRLIGYMTERARYFAIQKLQHEKVNALGQLAAGIAHELNNPAAAINSIASELNKRFLQNYNTLEILLDKNISADIIKSIRKLTDKKLSESKTNKLSTLKRIEKEDEIFDWLVDNGFPENRQSAEILAEFGITTEELVDIRSQTDIESFPEILIWLENILSSQNLIKDLDNASSRISDLVGAIKSHVHMDRTNEMQPTNVHQDIENTLTLLGYKLREKNISVKLSKCENLSEVNAYRGELNQVWTNLIDNAIFAMNKNGELKIDITCNEKEANIHIIDNGVGIPAESVSRIFDPFYTTKKVGEGTGIGLDLVKRIIKRHNGDIKVNSVPGRTEFIVCLPLSHEETVNESLQ